MLTSVYCRAHLLTHQRRHDESLALYARACAGYQAVLEKDHPTTRACHQHHADALASEPQGQPGLFPTMANRGASRRTGKRSKLRLGLA
jgi:hypothetical protein